MLRLTALLIAMCVFSAPGAVRAQRCHGAVGMGCGEWLAGDLAVVIPLPDGMVLCMINAGSWRHDECCESQPNDNPGVMCAGGGETSTNCHSQWARAHHRTINGYSWWRRVDPNRVDTTPLRVDHPLFCGRRNARIHTRDVTTTEAPFCCSRRSRAGTFWELLVIEKLRRCL